jgi:hypothetical protein
VTKKLAAKTQRKNLSFFSWCFGGSNNLFRVQTI